MTYYLKPFCPECGCRSLIRTNYSYEYYCQKCGQRVTFTSDELYAMSDLCRCNENDAVFGESDSINYKTKDEFYYAVHQKIQERKREEEEKRRKREEEKWEKEKQSEIEPGLDYQGFIVALALVIAVIIIPLIAASCNAF